MLTEVLTKASPRESVSPPEDPQFFLPVPAKRELDLFGEKVQQSLLQSDFKARWWPVKDTSKTR